MNDPSAFHESIVKLVATATSESVAATAEIHTMPGGASTRRYYRVLTSGGSFVAMHVPAGAKAEEIDKALAGQRWPFLEIRDLLAENAILVPRVVVEEVASGWLLLEDLGDDTLANYLLRHPEAKEALYTHAVVALANAQKSLCDLPKTSVVARRAFDVDLLRLEMEHFREWAIEARGLRLSAEDAVQFAAISDRLAVRIAAFPSGFVHRDYQSRNLMVRDDELVWIDFQDALQGPRVYDLVALLSDSYQEFDRAFIEARLDDYARAFKLPAKDRKALGLEFDLVTVQRKLKDAGRFVFIDRAKGNKSFLRFVAPTIKKVAAALARLPQEADMVSLKGILERTLGDEFKG
jgi:N-acetylmuramate 1-kinase